MRPLRIVQLIHVRWWNACAYYALSLSEGLTRRGHSVIVAGMKNSPAVERAKGLGLRTEESLHLTDFNPLHWARSLARLTELLDRERIDLVNAHRAEGHIFGAVASRRAGRPIPVIRTRGDVRPPKNNLFNRHLHQRWTERIIIPGDFMRANGFFPFSLNPDKVVTIPSGVGIEFFGPSFKGTSLRRELNIDDETSVVGIVARLSPVKGHRIFLQAAARVLRSCPRTRFLISGKEVEVRIEELRSLARRLGIEEKVIFLDERDDVRDVLAALDIGVVASVGSEAICRVLLELMAMGKPVVGTKVNVIPEIIEDGVSGYVVPPEDAPAMADAIIRMLRGRDKAEMMGRRGRSLAEAEYSLEIFTERTEQVYEDVLARNSRGV